MNTSAKAPFAITSKHDLLSVITKSQPQKYSVTAIPTEFQDFAKATLLKGISAEVINRSKKSDVAVVIVEVPKAKQ